MSDLTARNLLLYVGSVLAGALAASLAALAVQLAGADPVNWRPVIVAGIGPIVTGLLATQLTRVGSEGIAAQVDALKSAGTPKSAMVVLHEDEAAPALAGGLTPTMLGQVVDELERRMRETPASRPPAPPEPDTTINTDMRFP